MAFLAWLESTALAEWASVSLEGYPIVITAHSIGLAILVGAAFMLNFRLLGWIDGIPYPAFGRILGVAWVGFAVNLLSGAILFSIDATSYVSNIPFLVKISFVLLGVACTAQQQLNVSRNAASWESTGVPNSATIVAILSLLLWSGAIIGGRLIAYLY